MSPEEIISREKEKGPIYWIKGSRPGFSLLTAHKTEKKSNREFLVKKVIEFEEYEKLLHVYSLAKETLEFYAKPERPCVSWGLRAQLTLNEIEEFLK